MSGVDLRQKYSEILLHSIEDTNYPSAPMLTRTEAGIRDAQTLERYIVSLMSKAQGRFPTCSSSTVSTR